MTQHSNWNCPQCQNPNISGDLIKCPKCGKKRNRWGYWDCASCGTKSIRADHKECPNCGRPRARNVKFYLRDDLIEFVDEVSGESAVRIGRANWICPYCNQQNDDAVDVCAYCAAPRSESQERYHDVPAQEQQQQQYPTVKRKKKIPMVLACCLAELIGGVLLVLAAVLLQLHDTKESKKLRIAEDYKAYWRSEVVVEEYKTFEDSDWELPADARLLETREEDYTYVDHYEQRSREIWVDDPDDNNWDYGNDDWGGGWDDGGWADYGDGQFGMFRFPVLLFGAAPPPQIVPLHYETEWYDEPIYATEKRTKYYYEYDAWAEGRTVTVNGTQAEEPYYGEVDLAENEREASRTILYFVDFTYDSKPVQMEIPEDTYRQILADHQVEYYADITESRLYPKYRIANGE